MNTARKRLKGMITIIAVLFLHGCATQKISPGATGDDGHAQAEYEQLIERYEAGDVAVGVRDVRQAYALTDHYAPYGGSVNNALRGLAQLANSGDFNGCLQEASRLEAVAFPMLELHHYGWMCAQEVGEAEKAMRHERMARATFADIVADGDGKTTETAWHVLSTNELYLVLAIQRLKPKGQALVNADGRVFDRMTVLPEDGEPEEVRYFDITLQMTHGMDFMK